MIIIAESTLISPINSERSDNFSRNDGIRASA